ncbi:MAG: thioredoxin 2, partial [Marinobacter maritimus]
HSGPAGQYSIRSIPTLILFRNGRELARQSGAMNQGQINQWLQSNGC